MTAQQNAVSPGRGETALNTTLSQHRSGSLPKTQGGIDALLSRLERVKRTGSNTWVASCPTRDDKRPSMTIRELDDGRVLIHDFGGDSPAEILAAIGLTFDALFPPRNADPAHVGKPERKPFPAADILRAIGFEALVVGCAASTMATGKSLAAIDHDRLLVAVGRIQAALDAGGLIHG